MLEALQRRISNWFTSPPVLRFFSGFMRVFFPILRLGKNAFVFRHDDVLSTLRHPELSVTRNYAAKMEATTGAFFLGMDDGPRYQREVAFARAAVRIDDDAARIRGIVDRSAERYLEAGLAEGQFDLVQDFTRPIALDVVSEYFGVPGPNRADMARWMRSIFWELFLNFADDREVTQAALDSSRELEPYLTALIQQRKAAPGDDTFLDRLIALQAGEYSDMDDDALRRNLGGVIVGAVDTESKALSLVIQELLARPGSLASAREAAQRDDDAGVRAHAFEALRFNPHNPLVVRHALDRVRLAEGTPRECSVRRGTRVFAMTLSAMFDGAAFSQPKAYRPGRPLNGYLHFGDGLHRCFGEHIMHLVIPEALKQLLKRVEAEPVRPIADAIVYEGPFPDHFEVRIRALASSYGAPQWEIQSR